MDGMHGGYVGTIITLIVFAAVFYMTINASKSVKAIATGGVVPSAGALGRTFRGN